MPINELQSAESATGMTIADRIQDIIDQRKGLGQFAGKGYLDKITVLKSFYEGLKEKVESFENFRLELLAQEEAKSGTFYHYFAKDPTLVDRVRDASAETTLSQIDLCIANCERLHTRFNRDSINISVVGRARQGKSRLLQAISGLGNGVIPASDGGDCTGTTSVICNEKGATTAHAHIEFFTPEEMVKQVKKYISAIGLDYTVTTLNSISALKDRVKEDGDTKVKQMNSTNQSLFRHLRKYVEHFDDYKECIIKGEDDIAEEEIRSFVAQYDSNDCPTYKYLAVKSANIFTEFTYPSVGRIVLVDTIGLGDTSLGIEKKMLNTLQNNSDAAFLVRLPVSTGDHWSKEDNDLFDLIEEAIGNQMLEKWLFLVLNTGPALNNHKQVEIMRKEISERSLKYSELIETDCHDPKDVYERLLLPSLEKLVTDIADVDKQLFKLADKVFDDCYTAYNHLYNAASSIVSDDPQLKADLTLFAVEKWEEIKPLITGGIGELYIEYSTNREAPCVNVYKAIEEAREHIYDYAPLEEPIRQDLKAMDMVAGPATVYALKAAEFRSQISASFENININVLSPLQDILKWKVANLLFTTGRWNTLFVENIDNSICSIDWLRSFADEKLRDYPRLQEAVNFMLNYEMSMGDLLDYEVESCLEILDSTSDKFHDFSSEVAKRAGAYANFEAMSNFIFSSLLNLVPEIQRSLRKDFRLLATIPNHSLFARIRKFREKVVMSKETMAELQRFYIKNCATIWSEEYRERVNNIKTLKDLLDWINMLSKYGKSKFHVSCETNE